MARLDDLEFRITADTALLRADLNRGSAVIENFARGTETRFASLQNRFTQIAGKFRSTLALFGIGFGVRAFAGWIESATKLENLTGSQAAQMAGFNKSMEALNATFAGLSSSIATSLAPALQYMADGWAASARALKDFVDPSVFDRIGTINTKLVELNQSLADFESGKRAAAGRGQTTESMEAGLRKQIADLQAERAKLIAGPGDEETPAQMRAKALLEQSRKEYEDLLVPIDASKDYRPPGLLKLPKYEEHLGISLPPGATRAESVGDMNAGRLGGLDRMEPVVKAFDDTNERVKKFNDQMKEAKQRSKEFADTFAASFESRGIQALLDGDVGGAVKGLARDFAELILRLTILKPLAEGLSGFLTGGVSTGIGAIFGFAGGGRPPMGRASLVGENGPELFVPDVSGRILSNTQSRMALAGGGGGVTIYNSAHVTTTGDPADVEARVTRALKNMSDQTVAKVKDLKARGRL